jgi:hypothetical protein
MERRYIGGLLSSSTYRRVLLVMRILFGALITAVSIFLAWFEFGNELFQSPIFWLILVLWLTLGYFLFWHVWDDVGEESIGEKIDDLTLGINLLTTEIREMRSDLRAVLETREREKK